MSTIGKDVIGRDKLLVLQSTLLDLADRSRKGLLSDGVCNELHTAIDKHYECGTYEYRELIKYVMCMMGEWPDHSGMRNFPVSVPKHIVCWYRVLRLFGLVGEYYRNVEMYAYYCCAGWEGAYGRNRKGLLMWMCEEVGRRLKEGV